ncbi:MAG: HK97 gp10 family phage protein [Ramlibacter sp.]
MAISHTAGNAAFRRGYAALLKKRRSQARTITMKVAVELMQSLVLKSPVDTGRFRGNWQCGVGSVNVATDDGTDSGAPLRRTNEVLNTWAAGQTIYLTNSLPYARRLEYGHSKQAPQGMVRLTVAEYGQFLRAAVKGMK